MLIGTLYFTSPNGDGTSILRGHPSHAKVQPPAGQRKYLHFSVIFKTLSIGLAPGIERAASRSAVKRSTDWANPAAVYETRMAARTGKRSILTILRKNRGLWTVYLICDDIFYFVCLQPIRKMMHARKLENILPDGHANANIIENERETGFRFILPKAFGKTTKSRTGFVHLC